MSVLGKRRIGITKELPYMQHNYTVRGLTKPTYRPISYDDLLRQYGAMDIGRDLAYWAGLPAITVEMLPSEVVLESEAVSRDVYKKLAWARAQTGSSTVVLFEGFGAWTENGTKTQLSDSTGGYLNYQSGTSVGNLAGWDGIAADSQPTRASLGKGVFAIKTGGSSTDVGNNVTAWVGFTDTAVTTSVNPVGANMAIFRGGNGTTGGVWEACTKDGTTLNAVSTGINFSESTRYLMMVEMKSSSVNFYINGDLVATISSNLPGSTTALGPVSEVVNQAAGTARNFRCGTTILEWK